MRSLAASLPIRSRVSSSPITHTSLACQRQTHAIPAERPWTAAVALLHTVKPDAKIGASAH
jgi:hypothetical protein